MEKVSRVLRPLKEEFTNFVILNDSRRAKDLKSPNWSNLFLRGPEGDRCLRGRFLGSTPNVVIICIIFFYKMLPLYGGYNI